MNQLSKTELLSQFDKVLKRIGLKCIYTDIIKDIPNLTWKDIKQEALRKKIPLTKENVARIICNHSSKSKECDKQKLIELITFTDLVYTAKFSQRKIWHAFKLIKNDDSNQRQKQLEYIRNSLNNTFSGQNIKNQMNIYRYDGIDWIQIFIFKKLKTLQISKNYFAIEPQKNIIFSTAKNINRLVMEPLKSALLAREIKDLLLDGRMIKSLIQVLKNKENKAHNFHSVEEDNIIIPDIKTSYIKTEIGYNFLQTSARTEHANAIIGENPPILQTLTLKRKSNLRTLLNDDKFPDEKFDFQVRITSPNVMNFVKNLIEDKVISTPLPRWATKLPYAGSNTINVKTNNQ